MISKRSVFMVSVTPFAVGLILAFLAGSIIPVQAARRPRRQTTGLGECGPEAGMVTASVPAVGAAPVPVPNKAGASRQAQYFGQGEYDLRVILDNDALNVHASLNATVPITGDAGEQEAPEVTLLQATGARVTTTVLGSSYTGRFQHIHEFVATVNGDEQADTNTVAMAIPAVPFGGGGINAPGDVTTHHGPFDNFAHIDGEVKLHGFARLHRNTSTVAVSTLTLRAFGSKIGCIVSGPP